MCKKQTTKWLTNILGYVISWRIDLFICTWRRRNRWWSNHSSFITDIKQLNSILKLPTSCLSMQHSILMLKKKITKSFFQNSPKPKREREKKRTRTRSSTTVQHLILRQLTAQYIASHVSILTENYQLRTSLRTKKKGWKKDMVIRLCGKKIWWFV